MPTRTPNINAFDLKLLKALLNLKLTKNYQIDLTTYDKKMLCKTSDAKGNLLISPSYILKIWPKNKDISFNISQNTLDQLCGVLKKGYKWNDFVYDIYELRPEDISNNIPFLALNSSHKATIDSAFENIFSHFIDFESFSNEIIEKTDNMGNTSLNSMTRIQETNSYKNTNQELTSFIARIYIELKTRKAAIIIDEENDVITEIYDSWYELFCIIRSELKTLSPKYFLNKENSYQIVNLAISILNETLRPHLTMYQAKFRKWFEIEKHNPVNSNLSPQKLQQQYPDYQNLIESIRKVNRALIDLSEVFYSFIN